MAANTEQQNVQDTLGPSDAPTATSQPKPQWFDDDPPNRLSYAEQQKQRRLRMVVAVLVVFASPFLLWGLGILGLPVIVIAGVVINQAIKWGQRSAAENRRLLNAASDASSRADDAQR